MFSKLIRLSFTTASVLLLATQIAATNTTLSHKRSFNKRGLHNQLSKRGPQWSYYNAETGNAGSCGTILSNAAFTVAMNAGQMNNDLCFKIIRLTAGGKSTTATITDACPGCVYGGLDLTEALFRFFAPLSDGYIYDGNWAFTDGSGGGGNNNPPSPTTQSQAPAWTPTTTHTHASPTVVVYTSTSTSKTTTSTKSSLSSSSKSSTSQSSSSTRASSTSSPTPVISNLYNLNQIFIRMGALALSEAP